MERYKAVIFDLDGVLVDTEGATCEWIAQLLRPHGLQWTRELHRRVAGTVKFFPERCLELLEVSAQRKAELLQWLPPRLTSPEYNDYVGERLAIKAGAVALIQRLQSLQIPLALCTSRKGDGLQALMDLRVELAELLQALKVQVVGAIDPRSGQQLKGKPDPEVYSACAEILGVEASRCVVFEDAPSGVQSAKAAGCFTVAVPEMWMIGDPAAEEVFALADLRLESLESLLQPEASAWTGLFGPLPPLLVGFGNPTVDVISVIDDLGSHLLEFGLSPGTEATGLQDSQKVALVELAMKNPSAKVAGGACMNTLRVASWWGLRGAFIGAIGRDMEGLIIQEALVDAGVVPLLKQVEKNTGICGVLVDSKNRDRTLSMVRGAAAELDPKWLEKSSVSCLVNEASMVYITSFVLTSQPRIAAAEALAKSALRNSTSRTRLCLNLSSAGLLRRVKDSLLQLLPECSFLFGNCGELRAFAALMGWTAIAATASESDLDQLELIKRLAAMLKPGGMAVITAGAEPTMVATGDGYAQCFPVPLVPPETIVDMNGAGDAFVGGFLSQAIVAAPLSDCIQRGHESAAMILRCEGCNLPSKKKERSGPFTLHPCQVCSSARPV